MLKKEGFEFRKLVDIFDGGPTMHCELENIATIRNCHRAKVIAIEAIPASTQPILLSNCRMDFRCGLEAVSITEQGVTITPATAKRLSVSVDDEVRYSI